MLKREASEKIKKISSTFRVLLVTGPRQVGKTTLLTEYLPENMSYVSLDDKVLRDQAITNPKLFFQIISKEIFTFNDHDITLDEKYELFTKDENTSEMIPLTILYVDSFIITDTFIKVIYKTYKKISFPNTRIMFIYKQLANKTIYNYVSVKTCEPLTHEASVRLFRFWKKRTIDFISFFDKPPKKANK